MATFRPGSLGDAWVPVSAVVPLVLASQTQWIGMRSTRKQLDLCRTLLPSVRGVALGVHLALEPGFARTAGGLPPVLGTRLSRDWQRSPFSRLQDLRK